MRPHGDLKNETSQMTGWQQTQIEERKYHVHRPPAPHPHAFAILLLTDEDGALPTAVCHESTRRLLDEMQLTVVAPETGPLWAFDCELPGHPASITARQLLLDQILPQAKRLMEYEAPRIGLLGFGMGGQAALRLAYDYAPQFPVVAAVEPKIDFHLYVRYGGNEFLQQMFADDELARQHTAILHVHPLNWPRQHFFCCDPESPWFDGADRLRMKLAASGIPFECDLQTTTQGNSDEYAAVQIERVLNLVGGALERERLRLV